MSTGEILGAAAAAAVWLYKHARAVAAEAALAAEKRQVLADGVLTNEELEAIAVDVIRKRRPWIPEAGAKLLIAWACRAAKRLKPEVRR
jgi:hypothetical protein